MLQRSEAERQIRNPQNGCCSFRILVQVNDDQRSALVDLAGPAKNRVIGSGNHLCAENRHRGV